MAAGSEGGDRSSIRRVILEQARRAQVGHIGSALSVADIVGTLYSRVLRIPAANDPDRDRFLLSNGHTVLALYAALHLNGLLSEEALNTYCADGSTLGVHPQHALEGVDFTTGSLGQGLSVGAGAALAARMQGSSRRVFVVMSDAECNEGAVWEAAMFAAHHRLANLVAIIDLNGQQAYGYTEDVLNMTPMAPRWEAFGWDAHDIDGNDPDQIAATIEGLDTSSGRPHVLVAHTVFGKGVSFMESQIKWHYLPISDEQFAQAIEDIRMLDPVGRRA